MEAGMASDKLASKVTILVLMGTLIISSCTLHLPGTPVNPLQADFNLSLGTSWVYLDTEYQSATSDPNLIITAQYQLTETVTEINTLKGLFVAHVHSEQKSIQVPVGWEPFSPPGDFWYIVKSRQVFGTSDPGDLTKLDFDTLLLDFDFPLAVDHSWCPVRIDLKDPNRTPITNCDYAGKQTVLQESTYQVPAGKFEDCYQIDQASNGGDVFQWFCRGIGVVEVKFDHGGSRFGFEQKLTDYIKGSR
jgi:hypothetical protein